jgi:glycosyltransferase involved in cell wall biosynthesis
MISSTNNNVKKIKVLRIIARLNIGGPAINAILLSSALNNDCFISYLITGKVSRFEGDMSYYAEKMGLNPIYIPQLEREIGIFTDLKAGWNIYKMIKKIRPDIIHTHTAKAGFLGRSAAIVYNIRSGFKKLIFTIFKNKRNEIKNCNRIMLVHTFHGHIFHSYFNKIITFLFILIEYIMARFTDKIIVLSQSQKEEICRYLHLQNSNKISIIPLGFDLDPFLNSHHDYSLRKSLGINQETFLIGMVGRLTKIKNHRMLIDVAKIIKEKQNDIKVKFLIVGDGELRQYLEKYIILRGVEGSFIFTGWIKDISKVYPSLDLVVLTSLNEGTPVALIEAMACGLPIVAVDVGGVRNLMGEKVSYAIQDINPKELNYFNPDYQSYEHGILVKLNNTQSFADAIFFMIKNKNIRMEMGEKGRSFVEKYYSKKRLINDIEILYKNLMRVKGN